jgi:hypothetical protein
MRSKIEIDPVKLLFLLGWLLSLAGVYFYFNWLFSMPLVTTAAIVGIILLTPIIFLLMVWTVICFGAILS